MGVGGLTNDVEHALTHAETPLGLRYIDEVEHHGVGAFSTGRHADDDTGSAAVKQLI